MSMVSELLLESKHLYFFARRYFRVTAGETSCITLKDFRTIKSLVHLLITDLSKSQSIEILNCPRVIVLNIILLNMYVFHVQIEPNSYIVQSVQYEYAI